MTSNMKKGSLLLLLLFLTSCIPAVYPTVSTTKSAVIYQTLSPTLSPTKVSVSYPTLSLTVSPTVSPNTFLFKVFVADDHCLHFCWLGINPGVTSAEEARTLLEGSKRIDIVDISETSIEAMWSNYYHVFVHFEKDLVKSIDFDGLELSSSTVKDFIQFLGEPDEVRIATYTTYHCDHIAYLIYYSSQKIMVEVQQGSWDGPNPNDWIDGITLNTEFDNSFLQSRSIPKIYDNQLSSPQPWLGYGHLQEYLPGQKLPTGPCEPLPTSTP